MEGHVGITQSGGPHNLPAPACNFYLRIIMTSVMKNYICHVVEDFQTSTFLFWIIFKQAPFFPIFFVWVSLGKLNFFINYMNSFLFSNK